MPVKICDLENEAFADDAKLTGSQTDLDCLLRLVFFSMCHLDIFKVMDVICRCWVWPVVILTDGSLCKDYPNLHFTLLVFVHLLQRDATHLSFLFVSYFSLWVIFI